MTPIQAYIKSQLNDEQYLAAVHYDTSSLILAWAWSGKTRVLTYKIAYLVHGCGFDPSSILAVTFTNKAANEMKERLMKISQELQAQSSKLKADENDEHSAFRLPPSASVSFPRVWTFHSTFLRFLKIEIEAFGHGLTKDFWVYDTGECQSVIKNIIKELKYEERLKYQDAQWAISRYKNKWIVAQRALRLVNSQQEEREAMVYDRYEQELYKANMVDFDDLLLIPYLILRDHPEITIKRQRKFPQILVDEAQDTNWIQFELMKLLAADCDTHKGNITFIGDDFQSIYRWRGAMMENFLNVKSMRPDIVIYKLQTNYRSKPHIVHAGSHIIKNNTKQYSKDIVAHRDGTEKIIHITNDNEMAEAKTVVNLFSEIKGKQNMNWSDFAILYRKNAQSNAFEQVLIAEWVPYKIFGWLRFLERREVKDMISYLRYIYNPRDTVALKRIINVPKRSIWTDTVTRIEEYAQKRNLSLHDIITDIDQHWSNIWLTSRSVTPIKQFVQLMSYCFQVVDQLSPADLLAKIVKDIKYEDFLVHDEGKAQAEERMENIGELITLASRYSDGNISSPVLTPQSQSNETVNEEVVSKPVSQAPQSLFW
jgi:DNA helicase II / ATP-dependent DNA helicase PcrA